MITIEFNEGNICSPISTDSMICPNSETCVIVGVCPHGSSHDRKETCKNATQSCPSCVPIEQPIENDMKKFSLFGDIMKGA